MLTLNSLSSFGKPKAAAQRVLSASRAQTSPVKLAHAQDVFFSGHGDQSEKKQTKLVLNKQGLSFEPQIKKDVKAIFERRLDEMIAKDANMDQPLTRFGKPILHDLAYMGYNDLVIKAIRNGARFNHRDNQGYTALHWASRAGNADVVDTLLTAGAQHDAVDHCGNPALQKWHTI